MRCPVTIYAKLAKDVWKALSCYVIVDDLATSRVRLFFREIYMGYVSYLPHIDQKGGSCLLHSSQM